MLQAIILELALVFLSDTEGLKTSFILQLETGFGSTILNQAQNLDKQVWIFYDASVSANGFIADISATHFALVLNLNELDVGNETEHFDNMADNLVSWDGLNQLDLVVSLEISHLIFHLANYFEVVTAKHQLDVDVD